MVYRYAILGSSRGLGRAIFEKLFISESESQFLVSSRKINSANIQSSERVQSLACDFSIIPIKNEFIFALKKFRPTHIIYCAGGGPYGIFQSKKWSDHLWALNVNFLFPAELLHLIANQKDNFINLRNMTFVGSSIAEALPDPKAASYAAAKHALKGLITTVQAESCLDFSVKLFSPGYMLTDLLPLNSAPRLENKAQPVDLAADQLVDLIHAAD